MNIQFRKVEPTERAIVINQLKINNLPTEDIDESVQLFALFGDGVLIATGGLEVLGNSALLRSVSTAQEVRGKGFGRLITQKIEEVAHSQDIKTLYLLTTAAKDFFVKEQYQMINRTDTPDNIRQSRQFSSICPSTAIIMKKEL